jgi:hypothetical protein
LRYTHLCVKLTIVKKLVWLLIPALFFVLSCKKESGAGSNSNGAPHIANLVLTGDSLHIIGQFGPDPGMGLRRVIINEETIPEEKIGTWKEEEVTVEVERKTPEQPEEKKVTVEVAQKKSNVKIITIPPVPVSQLLNISFLQVKEPASFLYIHGQFGPDPGAVRRSIRVEQFVNRLVSVKITNIISWTSKLIICQIPDNGEGSCGKVIVKVDQDSAYRHLYTYAGIIDYKRPQGGASGTLAEKIRFHLRIRGDGEVGAANVPVIDMNTNVQVASYAKWEGSGEGNSAYNNEDGCASLRVVWTAATGTYYTRLNDQELPANHWVTFIKHRRDGFDLKMKFQANNVINSKVTQTPCKGDVSQEDRKESIYFDEFDNIVLPLRFEYGHILAGELKKTGLSSSAGLFWDDGVFQANLMTAILQWPVIYGELD